MRRHRCLRHLKSLLCLSRNRWRLKLRQGRWLSSPSLRLGSKTGGCTFGEDAVGVFRVAREEMSLLFLRYEDERDLENRQEGRSKKTITAPHHQEFFKVCMSIAPPSWKRQPRPIHILAPVSLFRTVTNSEQCPSTAGPDDDWMLVQDARIARVRSALKGDGRSVLICCSRW